MSLINREFDFNSWIEQVRMRQDENLIKPNIGSSSVYNKNPEIYVSIHDMQKERETRVKKKNRSWKQKYFSCYCDEDRNPL